MFYPRRKYKLIPIFITVDPERDTTEQIKSFLENFNPSIIGLTGSKSQVKKVINDYRIFVRINGSEDDDNYLVDHSSLFFLIDQEDNYISHFRPDGNCSRTKNVL